MSSPRQCGRFSQPSVDQCPKAIKVSAVERPGTSNQGINPGGAALALSVLSKSMTPWAEQKRSRVSAFTITRKRSGPVKEAFQ